MEKVYFSTPDGVKIASLYWPGDSTKAQAGRAVLLLHMMPATKESWIPFAEKLYQKGFSVLAIDLRGHGESTEQDLNSENGSEARRLNYKKFSDAEHQASVKDVESALEFLKTKKFEFNKISIVGASIGANLTINALGLHNEIKRGIALSPGLDYKGVMTEAQMKSMKEGQKIFLVASQGDNYSVDSVFKLFDAAGGTKKSALKVYDDPAGHGTDIFNPHPELMDELIRWLE